MSDVRRLACRQEAVEGLADRADVAPAHHDLGDVRPARRALLDQREHFLGVDRVAERGQAVRDAVHARHPLGPELPKEVAEPLRLVVEEVAEDVNLAARVVRVDLDARHDLERRMIPGDGDGRRHRLDRVVIGDRQHAHAAPDGLADQLGGRVGAVRRHRVSVEVDPAHWRRRLTPARQRRARTR